jgi:MFS family permease
LPPRAILVWRTCLALPAAQLGSRRAGRLRYLDPRIRRYVLTAIALFTGFSAIQQTLGFQLQDRLALDGIRTAQYTGAALMVSAMFTFVVQVTVMQRLKLAAARVCAHGPGQPVLRQRCCVAAFQGFVILALGMALLGTGLGLCMPAITAGASLAVSAEEQGGAAGVIAACPAVGFVSGPVIGGLLYPLSPTGRRCSLPRVSGDDRSCWPAPPGADLLSAAAIASRAARIPAGMATGRLLSRSTNT